MYIGLNIVFMILKCSLTSLHSKHLLRFAAIFLSHALFFYHLHVICYDCFMFAIMRRVVLQLLMNALCLSTARAVKVVRP